MAKDGLVTHLEGRGILSHVPVPACGAWSKRMTASPARVTCEQCKVTLDYAMAKGDGDE